MPDISVRRLIDADRAAVCDLITRRWGAETVVAHGRTYRPHMLDGFAAVLAGEIVGLLTFTVDGDACEIVTLDSLRQGAGVGTALIAAMRDEAQRRGCRRLWLITTNDNLRALRFYQKRGFVLAVLHRDAVTAARRLKPEIPLLGNDGIPLRDEIELELILV
ncbi:MAG: GNAT family N-acetyltransferase [Chloroflexi bacterium]|nr:GNAT family N-acetyltransferase [Chloroflexota bacterium]